MYLSRGAKHTAIAVLVIAMTDVACDDVGCPNGTTQVDAHCIRNELIALSGSGAINGASGDGSAVRTDSQQLTAGATGQAGNSAQNMTAAGIDPAQGANAGENSLPPSTGGAAAQFPATAGTNGADPQGSYCGRKWQRCTRD
jgi:hypothetical protein